jgi:hypothetical protein
MKKRGRDDGRLSKALALFDPPPAHRDRVAKNIRTTIDSLDRHSEPEFGWDGAGLKRYISALRELKASRAALHPDALGFLTLGEETVTFPFSGEVSVIEAEIREAEIMLEMCRRPAGHPVNKRVRSAVHWAGALLMNEGHKLTTEREGKWHMVSQIFADTGSDLRHHLDVLLPRLQGAQAEADASLAENPNK